ncbi:hypothetical protein ACFFNY_09645 [Paenibacillus hodogayensis]|uniref:Uncharacterized protein n=1 Tax=Paenibacillus hodogayensis TaxID=279208 RepID=A0ABV5VU58_9BACL
MPEIKPHWYNDLKNGPLVSASKATQQIINDIEMRVNITSTRRSIKMKFIWIPVAFCLVFVLIKVIGLGIEGNLWTAVTGRVSTTYSPADDEKVFNDAGNLITMDKKWLMPRYTFDAYLAFSKNKADEMLIGMEPLDIFRIYGYASEKGDYETLYALFIQGYGTPSREEFFSGVAKDPGMQERSKKQWETWKKSYRLQEEVNGTQVTIRMVSPDPSKMNGSNFRVIKNEKGIWKVAWPAIQ